MTNTEAPALIDTFAAAIAAAESGQAFMYGPTTHAGCRNLISRLEWFPVRLGVILADAPEAVAAGVVRVHGLRDCVLVVTPR